MVVARMKDVGAALARLDPESRALLELSLRRGMPEAEIGEFLRVESDEVGRRRTALFDQLADELGIDTREGRDELFATLQDLPDVYWAGGVEAAPA